MTIMLVINALVWSSDEMSFYYLLKSNNYVFSVAVYLIKIRLFHHLNLQVAYKLLELYVKLRELGHIQYINEGNTGPPLACTIDPENAEERVKETEVILKTWTHEVERLRHEFSWLLFFGVPKLLRLFRLLSEEQEDSQLHLKRVVHEISFLCTNNVDARQRINASVQVCILKERESKCSAKIEGKSERMRNGCRT